MAGQDAANTIGQIVAAVGRKGRAAHCRTAQRRAKHGTCARMPHPLHLPHTSTDPTAARAYSLPVYCCKGEKERLGPTSLGATFSPTFSLQETANNRLLATSAGLGMHDAPILRASRDFSVDHLHVHRYRFNPWGIPGVLWALLTDQEVREFQSRAWPSNRTYIWRSSVHLQWHTRTHSETANHYGRNAAKLWFLHWGPLWCSM